MQQLTADRETTSQAGGPVRVAVGALIFERFHAEDPVAAPVPEIACQWQPLLLGDCELDLPGAILSGDDYPVAVNYAGRCLAECNGRFASSECICRAHRRYDHKASVPTTNRFGPLSAIQAACSENHGMVKSS